MKKALLITAAIAALVFGIAGCGNSPSETLSEERPIVCLGDSLTEGNGASKMGQVDKSKSYPAFLQSKVTIPVINAGISGDTAARAVSRVETDVLAEDPQAVIIFLGANDFFQGRPANSTKTALQTIIDKVKGEDRKIFLVSFIGDSAWESGIRNNLDTLLSTLPFPLPSFINVEALLAEFPEYRKMFSELVLENPDVTFIDDIWTGVWGIHMSSDIIHPNAEGYSKIADTIYNAIKPSMPNLKVRSSAYLHF